MQGAIASGQSLKETIYPSFESAVHLSSVELEHVDVLNRSCHLLVFPLALVESGKFPNWAWTGEIHIPVVLCEESNAKSHLSFNTPPLNKPSSRQPLPPHCALARCSAVFSHSNHRGGRSFTLLFI